MFEAVLDIMNAKDRGVMSCKKEFDGVLEVDPFVHRLEDVIFPFRAKNDAPFIIVTIGIHDGGFEGEKRKRKNRNEGKNGGVDLTQEVRTLFIERVKVEKAEDEALRRNSKNREIIGSNTNRFG